MRTIVEEKTVYQFKELPEDVQEKIVSTWRDHDEYFWGDENENALDAFKKTFPVTIGQWEYGYRNYINHTENVEPEISALRGIRLYKYIVNNFGNDLHTNKVYYGKNHKKRVSRISYYDDCPLTGYCIDEDILEPIKNFLKNPDNQTSLNDILSDCLESWLIACKNDYESWLSEEVIIEDIEANKYEFTIDGKIV